VKKKRGSDQFLKRDEHVTKNLMMMSVYKLESRPVRRTDHNSVEMMRRTEGLLIDSNKIS